MSFIRAARAHTMMPAPRVRYYPAYPAKPRTSWGRTHQKLSLAPLIAKGARRIVSAEYRAQGLDYSGIALAAVQVTIL